MQSAAQTEISITESRFFARVFYVFFGLAILSAAINLAGRYWGPTIAMGGHTDDKTKREIVIGNDVLAIPSNMIRFRAQRRNGVANRVDLYLKWPEMTGYSAATRQDFNFTGPKREILFLSIEPRTMSRDMSGRYPPIYSALIEQPGKPGPGGLTVYSFRQTSGYIDEELVVSSAGGDNPDFVARCLEESIAKDTVSACERDIQFGDGLQLLYRFPRDLLGQWQALDGAVRSFAAGHLASAR
ncbi:hypothetical protein DUT91_20915 [Phyllobacterium salinisoli]|uniref:Transmembrane anchored protein n=1 Tax=Phyllobacterium salinisoli TaxID=1899321 RepID=A0A368JYM9_9HYPH|nr:hypothetical protein [Phyllobacterium salinisoli]RCS22004.1 hypothetical protein DUT91_20915 [Phyllobacterium salinisoli]